MAQSDSGERTEKPTPKRLREAREKGQIAKSPDLSAWISLLATTVLLQITIARGAVAMRGVLEQMGTVIANPDQASAGRFATDAFMAGIGIVAPMLIGMFIIVLAVNIAQVGFKPTFKKMKPDFSRLNPFKGMKRMVSASAFWELFKAIAKTVLLAVVGIPVLMHSITTLTSGTVGSMAGIAQLTADTALSMLRNIAAAGLLVAIADYAYQKRSINKQLRMTRQELREEMRQQEGNPEMRRAVRSRALAVSRNRMIGAVSAADVVVVNPTHYAVALKYEAGKGAPEVVAKGAGEIALGIRAEAERTGVPVVHEAVLCRAIYKSCELGQLVPVELYEAVAHLLAFVFGLKAKGRHRGYHELPKPALL
jgi:flagellar biosynthetic protein FlhB